MGTVDTTGHSLGTTIWCRPLLGLVVVKLPLVVASDRWTRLLDSDGIKAFGLPSHFATHLGSSKLTDGARRTYLWQHLPRWRYLPASHILGRADLVPGYVVGWMCTGMRSGELLPALLCIASALRLCAPSRRMHPSTSSRAPGSFYRLRFDHYHPLGTPSFLFQFWCRCFFAVQSSATLDAVSESACGWSPIRQGCFLFRHWNPLSPCCLHPGKYVSKCLIREWVFRRS